MCCLIAFRNWPFYPPQNNELDLTPDPILFFHSVFQNPRARSGNGGNPTQIHSSTIEPWNVVENALDLFDREVLPITGRRGRSSRLPVRGPGQREGERERGAGSLGGDDWRALQVGGKLLLQNFAALVEVSGCCWRWKALEASECDGEVRV